MEFDPATIEHIQRITARILATHPAGRGLCLVGGFRYRLLNESVRTSNDIDYHWEGDLQQKQQEIVEAFRRKLLPEVKRVLNYAGDARPAVGPDAESPTVRTVELAFYRADEPGSRMEIPIDLIDVACLDAPLVRTVQGTVFLTVSDADMIESKILACLARSFLQVRDVLDIFLFRGDVRPDASGRLSRKLTKLALQPVAVAARLRALEVNRTVHIRGIEHLLDEQVEPTVTANLRAAGGGAMIWEAVMSLLDEVLLHPPEPSS